MRDTSEWEQRDWRKLAINMVNGCTKAVVGQANPSWVRSRQPRQANPSFG